MRSALITALLCATGSVCADDAATARSASGAGVANDGSLHAGAVPAICHLLARGEHLGRNIYGLLDRDDDQLVGAADLELIMSPAQAAEVLAVADVDADSALSPPEVGEQAKQVTNGPFIAGLFGATGGRAQAWAAFGRQRAYIQDYDVAPGGNLDPQVGVIGTGNVITLGELRIMRRRR